MGEGKLKAVIVLQDGTILHGVGFGAKAMMQGELVFNTSMTGYQEALTDPSYAGQILLMTNPLIGNYGINKTDFESVKIHARGFVVRNLSPDFSHREASGSVDSFLKEQGIPGISGIDTRFLVRKIRTAGVMPALIATYESDGKFDFKKLTVDFDYSGKDFVSEVTVKEAKKFGSENCNGNKMKRVVLIDYGVKMGIVRELVARGVEVVVVPSHFSAKQILSLEPDGILLSNGPGDPSILTDAHKTILSLAESGLPMFGICLGHQLLAHAFGGKTYKLKFGHRGSNHPVLDKRTNRVMITTQNHGFAVDSTRVPLGFEITQLNLNDSTVEGMEHVELPIFSVQYHPEASPGPHDTRFLFDKFVKTIDKK